MLLLYVKVQKGGGSARMRRSSPTQRRCKMSEKDRKVLRVHCNEETCQNPNVRPYLGVRWVVCRAWDDADANVARWFQCNNRVLSSKPKKKKTWKYY